MKDLVVRPMAATDFAFADSVRALAGWNQTLADWERFLACAPQGCFVAEWQGSPAGTATTICYGQQLAWIGMVLVHPDRRRHGIGSALLQCCLEFLVRGGVRCVKLDATPLGKPIYERLGFVAEWALTRWERHPTASPPPVQDLGPNWLTGDWSARDLDQVVRLDCAAFGCSRQTLMAELAKQSRCRIAHRHLNGCLDAYGMLRAGSRASYLGPMMAGSPELAERVIQHLLAHSPDRPVFWDIPDLNEAGTGFARALGFTPQRPLLRMFRGENPGPGDPKLLYAIADPAVG